MVSNHLFVFITSYNGKKVNQDRVLIYLSDQTHSVLLAVFDGHGKDGHRVGSFIRHSFLSEFSRHEQYSIQDNVVSSLQMAETNLKTHTNIDSKRSGCTANIGCIYHDCKGSLFYSSVFVGDSE